MNATADVIVVGLGAMGGAACDHLARRGMRVIGLDRFRPPHTSGSSHGESRIIREAYFEDPRYVPIVQRAYECWMELERDIGRPLLRMTGGLMIGDPAGVLVSGAIRSAETHRLPYELLTAAQTRAKFPALNVEDPHVAVWEPRAGVLYPEACVSSQLERAARNGATLKMSEPALSWRSDGEGVEVTTAMGKYRAAQLVLAAGAWLPGLLPELRHLFTVERMVAYWFDAKSHPEWYAPDRFPIWIWEHERGRFIYGFPRVGEAIKIAKHHEGQMVAPDDVDRNVSADEIAAMLALVGAKLPSAAGALRSSSTCLYTNTPDEVFIIDWHPANANTLIVSACSGHGFKFANAIGEVVADLVLDGRSRFDLAPFALSRFGATA
jgi:sarcosine oxidase